MTPLQWFQWAARVQTTDRWEPGLQFVPDCGQQRIRHLGEQNLLKYDSCSMKIEILSAAQKNTIENIPLKKAISSIEHDVHSSHSSYNFFSLEYSRKIAPMYFAYLHKHFLKIISFVQFHCHALLSTRLEKWPMFIELFTHINYRKASRLRKGLSSMCWSLFVPTNWNWLLS